MEWVPYGRQYNIILRIHHSYLNMCISLFFYYQDQANMCYNFIFLYRECDSEVRLQSCDCNKKPFLSVLQYSSPSLITFFTFFLTEIHNFKVITLLWPFRENCCFAPGPTPILHPDLSNQPFPCQTCIRKGSLYI